MSGETLSNSRMHGVLQIAAMDGDRDVLLRVLNLEEPQNHSAVTIDGSDPAPEHTEAERKITEHLHSVTQSGDTVLHILVINGHNELATMVFKKDKLLLKATNCKMHETPLHCAARVGNKEIITTLVQIARSEVKEAARVTNCHGETALHEAAKYGHDEVVEELMKCLDPEVPYDVNNEGLSPLHLAIAGGYTSTVKTMLRCDYRLAKVRNSNGSFPVHVAAQMDNLDLVLHFMQEYPDLAKLKDSHGRNLFHILVEEENIALLSAVFESGIEMVANLIIAPDNKGNTLLHTAAIKGDRKILRAIWLKTSRDDEAIPNKNGLTPFELSARKQMQATDKADEINQYVDRCGRQFTPYWFASIMSTYENKREKIQVLGLGSVLMTTVAFAAAFTVPGGLNQEDGTPILGRKYIFKTFIVANTLAFLQGFVSLFNLIARAALNEPDVIIMQFSMVTFLGAAMSMVVAFGSGSYVMLAPVSQPLAILILVAALLFGSPTIFWILGGGESFLVMLTLVTASTRNPLIFWGIAAMAKLYPAFAFHLLPWLPLAIAFSFFIYSV